MEPLEFSKTGKKRRLKRQIFCFCGVTVVSSTVFEREMSCQHVDVKMRRLRIFSVEKPGIIPRWGQSVSDRDFHTCLFFMYDSLLLWYRPMDSPSDYHARHLCFNCRCGCIRRNVSSYDSHLSQRLELWILVTLFTGRGKRATNALHGTVNAVYYF